MIDTISAADQRYLTVRILYPKPAATEAVLAAVKQVAEAARKFEGLVEIGAWMDKENGCIVNISLWESKEYAIKSTQQMHPRFANISWSEWEARPAENFIGMTRVI